MAIAKMKHFNWDWDITS